MSPKSSMAVSDLTCAGRRGFRLAATSLRAPPAAFPRQCRSTPAAGSRASRGPPAKGGCCRACFIPRMTSTSSVGHRTHWHSSSSSTNGSSRSSPFGRCRRSSRHCHSSSSRTWTATRSSRLRRSPWPARTWCLWRAGSRSAPSARPRTSSASASLAHGSGDRRAAATVSNVAIATSAPPGRSEREGSTSSPCRARGSRHPQRAS
mmetsp:Transcript_100199/g.196737  ORF Transcript_100199/g.196737 Transcript_100199/m.196737 type:complete len:205 (-) Transcript_100199:87-701(-)